MSRRTPNIHLYTDQTPNGIKISITLEELGLPYEVSHVDISTGKQKEQWFLEINPNGRIPALTDTFTDNESIRLFESGSIMQYLVDEYDKDHKISYPRGSRSYYQVNNWLFFLNAGVGPMQGQSNHFHRYAKEDDQYGKDRYRNETRRLYRVLEDHLKSAGTSYLVGDKCTIADIAHWGWLAASGWAEVKLADFPVLQAWEQRMLKRSAVERGRNVPTKQKLHQGEEDPEMKAQYEKESREWVQKGMEDDANK